MTVRENLELGAYLRRDGEVEEDMRRVFELFPRLEEREQQKAGTMSGGEQQMLAIGRALMADPKLLLLDEPSMGIAPILVERIYETIAEINQQGTTILLVEQNANFALEVCKRGYVLETGTVALSDEASSCRTIPRSRRRTWAYDRHRRSSEPPPSTCCRLARLRDRGLLPLRPQGLRREGRASSTGLLLSVIGALDLARLVPAKRDSRWKLQGTFGSGGDGATVARARRGRRGRTGRSEQQPLHAAAPRRDRLRRALDRRGSRPVVGTVTAPSGCSISRSPRR